MATKQQDACWIVDRRRPVTGVPAKYDFAMFLLGERYARVEIQGIRHSCDNCSVTQPYCRHFMDCSGGLLLKALGYINPDLDRKNFLVWAVAVEGRNEKLLDKFRLNSDPAQILPNGIQLVRLWLSPGNRFMNWVEPCEPASLPELLGSLGLKA